jgi:dipeptidyl aminopeptidase/acylaminoacyl peptidase
MKSPTSSSFVAKFFTLALLAGSTAACSRPDRTPDQQTSQQAATPATAAPAGAREPKGTVPARSTSDRVEIADLYYLKAAGDPQISPDGARVAFTVQFADRIGLPYTRIFVADLKSGQSGPLGAAPGPEGASPRWSPDGSKLAFLGRVGDGPSAGSPGVIVANADGSGAQKIADTQGSNHPLPQVGDRLAWSPDSRRLAFVSAVPGPEPDMEGDPIVITRYWFRPASSAGGRFSDNRRLKLFVVDVASKQVTPLTTGTTSEHSIDWSPDGKRLLFLSNHEPDPDFFFNYDIFTIDVGGNAGSGAVTQVTKTRNNEFGPSWSPDGQTMAYAGLKRLITSSETNMEDTHVWTLDAATGARKELGLAIDNRQGRPQWSRDGKWLYFTVQSRGSVALYRLPAAGGPAERVGPAEDVRGSVMAFALGQGDDVVAAMATPGDVAELYVKRGGEAFKPLTMLNAELLGKKKVAEVEAFTFKSVGGLEVEAFLTKPAALDPASAAKAAYPMIVNIHGGPHGQQGPLFTHRAQAYAAHGYAVLMVNYRGSTGYGQAFSNAIAKDQNGAEAKDVLAGVDAALAKYPWIDGKRLGVEGQSYGGQLTNWLVTQTDRFAGAIPAASISNLVSHNYMSVYHDYLEQEYDHKPHVDGIVDQLWERSAIRIANRVKTPVMFVHGDNDQLVNPAEIEQFYIALKDVGVETIMVRYPREGHSARESGHLADVISRAFVWYDRHFAARAHGS